jgi:tRNA(Glu) U13 pseudouridine synthase TruD
MSGEKMSQEKKVVVETKQTEETKLFEEKKAVDPYIAGFVESMAKTNTEKITKDILEDLSEDTGDNDNYDVESGMRILRISLGGQVIQSLENQPSNRVILRT